MGTNDYIIDLIGEHIESIRHSHSPRTVEARERIMRQLHRYLPAGIAYATTAQIRDWLATPGWSPNTVYTYTGHVLETYRWLAEVGYLNGDPTAVIRRHSPQRGLPRPIKEEELALLLAASEPIPTIALLGAFAGMRRSEIAGCWREHITEERILIVAAKGGQQQAVPTHPEIWAHVRDRPAGPLLVNQRGRQMTPGLLAKHWRDARESLGLPGNVVPHQLRHRYGTVIQREGKDIRVTQECMRHASIATTQIYTQVTSAQRAAAVALLPLPVKPSDMDHIEPGPSRLDVPGAA